MYQRALLIGATGIFVVHNHPSGRAVPSEEDRIVTEKLQSAGEAIGIRLIDHVIIGDYFYSFHKEGLLK